MSIQEYFGDWSKVIDLDEADRVLKRLNVLSCNNSIYPSLSNVFRAFRLCPLSSLRCVIIGQDPYTDNLDSSLEILRDSVIDFTVPHRVVTFDQSLEKWASQGVLVISSTLSCQVRGVESHALLWRPFIKSLLLGLSRYHTGIVYILMGSQAQSFEFYINTQWNYVFKTRHPMWYVRQHQNMPSDIWKQINSILTGLNGSGIEWYQEN